MKPVTALILFVTVIAAFAVGVFVGSAKTELRYKTDVLSGPYSDDFAPALAAIDSAKAKVQAGDRNIIEELNTARNHLENAQSWAERFLGEPDAAGRSRRAGQ